MRQVITRLFAALIATAMALAPAAAQVVAFDPIAKNLAIQAKTIAQSALPGSAGNHLANFANPALVNNGHKVIFRVGNSTVWNATGYYTEWCNSIINNPTLKNINLTPCSSNISGYQILDNVGTIRVTFTGSTPTGYSVGDLILSLPTAAGLNVALGTGVITAMDSTTITYTLLPNVPAPASGSFVSSGGLITNSLVNFGYNGATSPAITNAITPLLAKYARPGDLVMVRGPLINDVRLGACDLACATSHITVLFQAIQAAIPARTDIAWSTENALLTTDPSSTGYVSPLGSSAAYTKIVHDAVFAGLGAQLSKVVLWDNMQLVYSQVGNPPATSVWMGDILHPAPKGQQREASLDGQIITGMVSGQGFQPASSYSDPYLNTGANAAVLNGNPRWIESLKTAVGFSEYLEDRALVDNYTQPWAIYPDAVLDLNRYDLIMYGTVSNAGTDFIRVSQPAVNGVSPTKRVLPGDLIWLQGWGVFQAPSTTTSLAINVGGTVYYTQVSSMTAAVPASVYTGQPIVIVRPRSYQITDIGYVTDPVTFPYRHRIAMAGGGTNYMRFQFSDGTPSWPTAITTSDVLSLPCGLIPLTGATFTQFSTYTQINLTGSFTACGSDRGWVFGAHAMEGSANVFTNIGPSVLTGQVTLGASSPAVGSAGALSMAKITSPGTAPGAGYAKMEWVAGTTTGTCKLIAYAGTSTTAVTIIDNVGAGC